MTPGAGTYDPQNTIDTQVQKKLVRLVHSRLHSSCKYSLLYSHPNAMPVGLVYSAALRSASTRWAFQGMSVSCIISLYVSAFDCCTYSIFRVPVCLIHSLRIPGPGAYTRSTEDAEEDDMSPRASSSFASTTKVGLFSWDVDGRRQGRTKFQCF